MKTTHNCLWLCIILEKESKKEVLGWEFDVSRTWYLIIACCFVGKSGRIPVLFSFLSVYLVFFRELKGSSIFNPSSISFWGCLEIPGVAGGYCCFNHSKSFNFLICACDVSLPC